MNILIISQYAQIPSEGGNDRFNYIANLLAEKNEVEIVTSSFSHINKCQRIIKEEQIKNLKYKLTTIYEPEYKKNVCLKRFYSHFILAKNLSKYLKTLNNKPDIIYCAVPSLDVAKVTAKYAKKNDIRFIIDVQDLWPEAFKMVFNIPIISNIIFYPMKRTANYIYKQADDIVAVSNTYMERAAKVNRKYRNKLSVFLGTDLNYFDKCKNENEQKCNDKFIRLAYVGTLGSSYDLKCVIDALDILNHKGINNIKFIIMGKGPLQEEFEEYAKKKNVNCEFTGLLNYDKMVGYLCSCDIAVNPISKGAAQSIINKVGDYAMAGLPVISTQENEEYRKLVEEYNIGFNCENGNSKDVAEKIEILYNNMNLRKKMGTNNRKLAEEKFDRNKTYSQILNIIFPKKVSIIVPIYNTEKYLNRCITSLINQDYENLEIILINDGSTDSSLSICHKYKNIDNRIIVINKENEGQSKTRNMGLDMATGYYISFIDSDDFINKKMISTLVKNIESYKADVSVCSLKPFKDMNKIKDKRKSKIRLIDSKETEYITAKDGYGASVCNKLYKKHLISNIRFESNNINVNEDGNFNKKVNKIVNKIVFENFPYYYYNLREDSTLHGDFKEQEVISLIESIKNIDSHEDLKRKRYQESRLAIKSTKIIIGIVSTEPNIDENDEKINLCFNTIKKYYKTMLINKNISFSKKIFVTFCLITKKMFIKRNKTIVKLCKKMRKRIG